MHVHAWRIDALWLAVHQDVVAGLDQNVVQRIGRQSLAQGNAENLGCAVGHGAE